MVRGGIRYYDRDGKPISVERFAALFSDASYRMLNHSEVALPGGAAWISTAWFGLDRALFRRRPVIFETAVFASSAVQCDYSQVYCTEYAALAGHDDIVRQLREGVSVEDLRLPEYLVDG